MDIWSPSHPRSYQNSTKCQPRLQTCQGLHVASSPLWTKSKRLVYENLHDLPPGPFPAFFLTLHSGSTCFSWLLIEAACSVREPFPRPSPPLRLRAGDPPPGNTPSPCSVLPGNKTFTPPCLPHGVITCLRLAPPAPLDWKLFKGGPHRPRL